MLYSDPWYSWQSGISRTGCLTCVIKVIAGNKAMRGCKQIPWITGQKNRYALWNYMYSAGSHGQSHRVTVMDMGAMAMKGYSAFCSITEASPSDCLLSFIQDTHWWSLTSVQRCRRCILQPQSNGQKMLSCSPLAVVYLLHAASEYYLLLIW